MVVINLIEYNAVHIMKKYSFTLGLIALFVSTSTFAGHCKYLPAKDAMKVFEKLSSYKKGKKIAVIDEYCKPCKDSYVKALVIDQIAYAPYEVKGYGSISINGKPKDLAFLYLDGKNLGAEFNCKTTVSDATLFTQEVNKSDN